MRVHQVLTMKLTILHNIRAKLLSSQLAFYYVETYHGHGRLITVLILQARANLSH